MRRSKTVLVTLGATMAPLDSVRFLSNRSSGATGLEVCRALLKRRFRVVVVAGRCEVMGELKKLRLKRLVVAETNQEMLDATLRLCASARPDAAVFTAAVLDFVPRKVLRSKVASRGGDWTIRLKAFPKIIDRVAKKFPQIERVAFKLETKTVKSPQTFGEKVWKKGGHEALCLNFLSKVGANKHEAHLFSSQGYKKVKTKKAIGEWIANCILRI